MNVKDIVLKYLKENNFHGLYDPEKSCVLGCSIKEIFACGRVQEYCEAGYKHGNECTDCKNECDITDSYIICGKRKQDKNKKRKNGKSKIKS